MQHSYSNMWHFNYCNRPHDLTSDPHLLAYISVTINFAFIMVAATHFYNSGCINMEGNKDGKAYKYGESDISGHTSALIPYLMSSVLESYNGYV
jgi:hypothetical protein